MATVSYLPVVSVVHNKGSETHDCGRYWDGVWQPLVVTVSADAAVPESDFPYSSFEDELVLEHRNEQEGPKWSDVRKSGRVKMTDLSVGRTVVKNHLGTYLCNSHDYDHYEVYRMSFDKNHTASKLHWGPYTVRADSHWVEQGPLSYWKLRFPALPHSTFVVDDMISEIDRAKTDCWNEVLNGYSFGAEMGEIKGTFEFIKNLLTAARHPIESFKAARDLMIKQAKKEGWGKLELANSIGSLWMQYRYALMPIIYSICDVKKLLANSPEYITARRRVSHNVGLSCDRPASGSYFHDEYTVSCETTITVKGCWKRGSSSVDRIDFNIITTAWELLPLSFVVDWFVNVGDWLASYLRSFSTSADVIGCVATRTSINQRTFFTYERDERISKFWPAKVGGPWPGGDPNVPFAVTPPCSYQTGSLTSQTKLLQETQSETYERKVFTQDDLGLALAPFMNWKRYVDGSVLSLQLLQKYLRSIK